MADKKRIQDKERILRYLLRNGSVQNTFKVARGLGMKREEVLIILNELAKENKVKLMHGLVKAVTKELSQEEIVKTKSEVEELKENMNKKFFHFHLFMGKGGTGKTTLSAAAAIYYAEKGKNTLVASIDPAHSLSDCLEISLGSEPTKITKNLFGIEIDAKKALKRDRFLIKQTHDIFKKLGIHDIDVLETLPGIDEIMAYDMLVEFMENKNYDQIVLDTAPSGHALRFLSIPGHIDDWLKKSFRATRQIYGLLSIAKRTRIEGPSYKQEHEERNRMSRIYQILINPKYSSISLVMLPEKTCIAETERDLITLLKYTLPVKEIIVNKIFPKSNNQFLKNKYSMQKINIIEIKKKFSHLKIKEILYLKSEVIGLEELKKISNMLFL